MISLRKTGGLALPVNQQGPGLSGGKRESGGRRKNLCAEINCRDIRKLNNWEAEEGVVVGLYYKENKRGRVCRSQQTLGTKIGCHYVS